MDSRRPLITATRLILISGSGILASNILLPAIPLIAAEFSVPVARMVIATACFSGGYAVAHLAYGFIPETVRTSVILALGLSILLFATTAALTANAFAPFLVAAAAMDVGAAAAPALLPSLISDAYQETGSSSTIGMLAAMEGILPPLAAFMGTAISLGFGWQIAFLVIVAATLVSILSLRTIRSNPVRRTPESGRIFNRYRYFIGDVDVVAYTMAVSAPFAALLVVMNLSPVILVSYYKVSAVAFGVMQIFTVCAFISGSFGSAHIAKRFGLVVLNLIGIILMAMTVIAFVIQIHLNIHSVAVYVAAIIPSQIGFGIRLGPILNEALRVSIFPRVTPFPLASSRSAWPAWRRICSRTTARSRQRRSRSVLRSSS